MTAITSLILFATKEGCALIDSLSVAYLSYYKFQLMYIGKNKNSLNEERVKSKSKLEQKRKANVNRMVDKTNEQVHYTPFSRVCKLSN